MKKAPAPFVRRGSPGARRLFPQPGLGLEVVACQLRHHAAQGEQGDEVGDGHQSVEGVGNIPHRVNGGHAAHHNNHGENHLIDLGRFVPPGESGIAVYRSEYP